MIAIITYGIKDYDINMICKKPIPVDRIKWDKIVLGTDADSDGDHIKALMLRFFVLYMPELIMAGKVYASMPPLYGMVVPGKPTGKYKKAKIQYFLNRLDYIEFLQKNFSKTYNIQHCDGKSMSAHELSLFLYKNYDYVYTLGIIAQNHSIPPQLLEEILILRNLSEKEMIKKLKKKYRFINIERNGNTLIVTGSVDGAIRTVFVNDILISECADIIKILDENTELALIVNGEVMSLYQIMSLFNKSEPTNIQRYKGLGEMNGPKLFDSTLDPDNRTIVQYTMDSALETIEKMKYCKDNMRELLNDITVSRFDVMD